MAMGLKVQPRQRAKNDAPERAGDSESWAQILLQILTNNDKIKINLPYWGQGSPDLSCLMDHIFQREKTDQFQLHFQDTQKSNVSPDGRYFGFTII